MSEENKTKTNSLKSLTNMNIGKKILFGFIFVTAIGTASNLLTRVFIQKITDSANYITTNAVPLAKASLMAKNELSTIETEVSKYLLTVKKDNHLMEALHRDQKEFEYLLHKMMYGKNDERVKTLEENFGENIPFSQLHLSKQTNPDVVALGESIIDLAKKFEGQVNNITSIHDEKTAYIFDFKGKTYTIKDFASYLFMDTTDWWADVGNAASYNVEFKGITDEAKSDFFIWYKSFKTEDKKLQKELDKYESHSKRLHKFAREINLANAEEKKVSTKQPIAVISSVPKKA